MRVSFETERKLIQKYPYANEDILKIPTNLKW